MDTNYNPYYLVACNIRGLPTKLFVVDELDQGMATLQREDLRSIVTGGIVESCQPFILQSAFAGY